MEDRQKELEEFIKSATDEQIAEYIKNTSEQNINHRICWFLKKDIENKLF